MSIDLKKQVFNFDYNAKTKSNDKKSSLLTFTNLVFAGSALVVVAVFAVLLKIKRPKQSNETIENSSDNNNESSIGQSLI